MTRIAVLSDSHDATGMLELVAQFIAAREYDHVFHLGDVVGDARRLAERLNRKVLFVEGNCDFFSRDPKEIEVKAEGVRMLLTHGDKYGVKGGLDRLSYRAEAQNCGVALFGHTHVPFAGHVGAALLVNPGALENGRFAELEIENGKAVPRLLRL